MSLAQIGENSVWIEIERQKYNVKELFIPKYAINKTAMSNYQLVHAWQKNCIIKRTIVVQQIKPSAVTYQMTIISENKRIDIQFVFAKLTSGLSNDIRLIGLLLKEP